MARGTVREHLEKAREAAIAAVGTYNRPKTPFRAGNYIVLMVLAWTSLFHAIFYRKGQKPWHKTGAGPGTRYKREDGDPKHWELAECLRQFYGNDNPPERQNLQFFIGLRNKIEHRSLPQLDLSLFGECQAMLMNFEDFVVREFGPKYALEENLAIALQFSRALPAAKVSALKKLAASRVRRVAEYIETFRASLPSDTLNNSKYRFAVYLIPKIANRASAADMAVEFVQYDPSKRAEMQQLEKVAALIRERHVPVVNFGYLKAGQVVEKVRAQIPFKISLDTHTKAWRYYKVRPPKRSADPEKTRGEYCVYDAAHKDYVYTEAWVDFLQGEFSDPAKFQQVTGKPPVQLPTKGVTP